MTAIKRFSQGGDVMADRHVKWVAKATISKSGSVTVDANEALKQTEVKNQLKIVGRIREESRRFALGR